MKPFMDKNFLLSNETAQKLYFDYAATTPVLDYHCHINPQEIYEDRQFENITQVWLGGDHYKWRFMRSCGVDEYYITGEAPDKEKFFKWAECLGKAIGNPLFHWSHLELQKYFGYNGVLNKKTAEEVWNLCNAKLADPSMSVRNIIKQSNVTLICTTDDPVDSLEWHKKIAEDNSFDVQVLPAWRPDKAMNIEKPTYLDYLATLSDVSGIKVDSFASLCEALKNRMDFFASMGCSVSDHGLEYVMYAPASAETVESIFAKRLGGASITKEEEIIFKTAFMVFVGKEYAKRNWVMQLHYGCKRDNNVVRYKQLGPDTGSLDTYKTFDEVLESVDQQFEYWTNQMCSSLNIIEEAHREIKPLPYVSAFFEDCMESGKDLTEGGAKYNGTGPQASGMATCADELSTIKQLVFDEKKVTGAELLQAVRDNWEGHEKLYALVNSSKVHHYGNDDDYADELFKYMFECYCRHISGRENTRGGHFSPGVYSVNANVAMGLNTNASVDGRKKGEAISDNMGPVHTDAGSHDICGPTALTNSLTKVDHSLATNGTLMNLRFPQEAVAGIEGRDNLISFIDEYMNKSAMHVQFNIMSSETMKAAQKNPEDYKDMLVRVAGYSAYFVELGKPLQKDLIQRTELHF